MLFDLNTLEHFTSLHQERLRFDSWASVNQKFFYINTPKAGCTKIKKMLQELCGLPVPEGISPIHQRQEGTFVKTLLDHTKEEQLYLLNAPEVYRFCFVRNPYTRVLSAYLNKVIGSKSMGLLENI